MVAGRLAFILAQSISQADVDNTVAIAAVEAYMDRVLAEK